MVDTAKKPARKPMSQTSNVLYVVSHTHWDREWRLTFEQYRMKLVDCLDHLLDLMESDPGYKYFTLDGQMSLLGDYIEIRPENRGRLEKLIKAGRLFLGPWFTLVDENLIWGESMARNLIMGHREAERWGGRAQKVGYGISSFGHINQMPQIMRECGIDNFSFSRGISQWQTKTEFIWEGPDGSEVLVVHLPDNYTKSNWFYVVHRPHIAMTPATLWRYTWRTLGLPMHAADPDSVMTNYRLLDPELSLGAPDHGAKPADKKKALAKDVALADTFYKAVKQLESECAADSGISALLAMDGVDHLEPNPWLPQIIALANEREGREFVRHSNFPEFLAAVRKQVKGMVLQRFRKEMRDTTREGVHNGLFGYVMSARMDIKLVNQKTQRALVRWAEPMNVLAALAGLPWPEMYLRKAWKLLLENHAHDSLGGCSVDKVHEENLGRYEKATQIADELTQRAFWHLTPQIDTTMLGDEEMALIVYNPLPFARSEMVETFIDIPDTWKADRLQITDLEGRALPYQKLGREKALAEMLQPMSCQLSILMDRFHVRFPAENLPACGWTTFIIRPMKKAVRPQRWPGSLSPAPNMMENEHVSVLIEPDGSFRLYDKATDQEYAGLNYYEDDGEAGDAWQHVPPIQDEKFSTWMNYGALKGITKLYDGPCFCTFRIEHELMLPEAIYPKKEPIVTEEGTPETPMRSPRRKPVNITTDVTLSAGSRRVEIETTIVNRCKDHRLRACFPTGRHSDVHAAAVPFDVIERSTVLPDTHDWKEPAYAEHPTIAFVNVQDAQGGLAVLTNGVTEYTVKDDLDRTVALTLMRAVGRSTGEDWDPKGSQLLGEIKFRYALVPHAGDWAKGGVVQEALAHATGLRATQSTRRAGRLPARASLVEFDPAGALSFDGLKKAESRDTIILRFHNPAPAAAKTRLRVGWGKVKRAWQTNILEERQEKLPVGKDGVIELQAGAKKIVTVELEIKL